MMHISIALTMLTIIASIYLLDKVKREALSPFFKWVAYIFITAGFIMLICQAVCGICSMCHKGGCGSKGSQEMCAPAPHGGGGCGGHGMNKAHGCKMDKGHDCGDKKDACCADGKGEGHGHGMKKCEVKEEVIIKTDSSETPHTGHGH